MSKNVTDMTGKRGLIFGIANDRSYAWHIAKALVEAGADCLFTYLPDGKMERRVRSAVQSLGIEEPWLAPCDAGCDESLDAVFERVKTEFGRLDFLVHSIAYADKNYLLPGRFHQTPRDVWTSALDISAYTLVAMAGRAKELMSAGGSIVSMSYFGAEKVVPGYNIMGVAKAALEQTTRYLAAELGEFGIRVNAVSGGPLRTISAMAVGAIDHLLEQTEKFAPLRRNISGEEAGQSALFLLSDAASGITGEVLYADGGFNILSNFPSCNPQT